MPSGTETSAELPAGARDQPVDRRRAPGGGAHRAGARSRGRGGGPGRERRPARRRRGALRAGHRLVRQERRIGAGAGRGQGSLPRRAVLPPHRTPLGLPGHVGEVAVAAERRRDPDACASLVERSGVGCAPPRRAPRPGALARLPHGSHRPGDRLGMDRGARCGRDPGEPPAPAGTFRDRSGALRSAHLPPALRGSRPDGRGSRPPRRRHRGRGRRARRAVQLLGYR